MFKKILFLSLMGILLFACEKKEVKIIQKEETPAITKTAIDKPIMTKPAWKGTGPNKRFYKVAEKLDRDGDLYLYMDIKNALREAAQGFQQISESSDMPDELRTLFPSLVNSLENTGLFGMEDFGMSGIRIDDRYQYKTYIRANDTKTVLFRMLGETPHTSLALKYAPNDIILFHAMDMDLPTLHSFIKSLTQGDNPVIPTQDYNDTMQKFQEEFGISIDELVSGLGTEFAFLLRLDPNQTIKIPDTSLVIRQPQFAILIPTKQTVLHEAIAQNLSKNNITLNDIQSDAIKRTQIAIPPIPDFPMNPEIAFVGEYEILCSHASLMDEILNAMKNGKGLSGTVEFQSFMKNLPQKYNGLTFISEKFGQEIITQISNALNTEEMKGKVNTQALSDFLKIFLGGRMSVRINEPEGIWIVTQQIVGKDSMTLPGVSGAVLMSLNSGGAVGVVMILSAIAIPNFLEAQTRSKVSRTKADMRSLATAIESYNVDYNTYPSPNMNELREAPGILTTPVAYITGIPQDSFAAEKGAKIRYYRKDNAYLLYAAGPDRVIDIDPEADFDPQNLEKLKDKTYDPTNGTVSSGDIVRTNRGY